MFHVVLVRRVIISQVWPFNVRVSDEDGVRACFLPDIFRVRRFLLEIVDGFVSISLLLSLHLTFRSQFTAVLSSV